MKTKGKLNKLSLTFVMMIFALIIVYPFIWMISSSFKPLNEIHLFPPSFFSKNYSLKNYEEVLFKQTPSFALYIKNTVIVAVTSVIGTMITSAMAGYAFAKLEFKFRDELFLLYLATMMIPFQVLMVPQFIQFKYMGIFNTLMALILPRLFSPLSTFMMRQFFLDVPTEIIESGRIEGASEFRVFSQLVVPIAKPGLVTVGILNFVWRWNDYESPLIFLTNKNLYTLTVGLTNFVDESGFAMGNLIMAGATIALIPMLIIYMFSQKFINEDLAAGSVKG